MSQTVKQILGKEFSAKDYRFVEEGEEEMYEYIIHEAAENQVQKFSNAIQEQLQQAITPMLQEVLAPQLEVRHVREEGLRIWGKADNVAFSKSTIVGLLEMLQISNSSKKYETVLFSAGRQAALGFFDQFRRILRVGSETHIPKGVITFLEELGEFDERSGWWTEIDYDESIPELVPVTVLRPFWRFPYTQTDNHHFSSFAAGYILSLHNSCYDYLSIISQVTDRRFDDLFAIEAKVFKDPDLEKCHMQLRRTKKKIAEFDNINAKICLLVEWLLDDMATDKHRDEISNKLHEIDNEILEVFGEESLLDKAKLDEFQMNQNRFRPEFVRNEFTRILQQVRIRYEDLRIEKLRT
jgi:hypothetical protein